MNEKNYVTVDGGFRLYCCFKTMKKKKFIKFVVNELGFDISDAEETYKNFLDRETYERNLSDARQGSSSG